MEEDSSIILPIIHSDDGQRESVTIPCTNAEIRTTRPTASGATTLFAAAFERYCLGIPLGSTLSSPSNHVQHHAVSHDPRVQYNLARTGAAYDDILKHFKDI